jgi:hypothetical protein
VTAQRLVPSVRKRCVCFAVLCVFVSMGGVSFHFYEPFISIWAVPSYVFGNALPMTVVSYWILTFRSLIIAGTSFSTCLKVLCFTFTCMVVCQKISLKFVYGSLLSGITSICYISLYCYSTTFSQNPATIETSYCWTSFSVPC